MTDDAPRITVERDGHVLLIGFNRPDKRNAADLRMLQELALAYGELERDPELRVGFVFAHGDHFTGGLDLADVAPRIGPNGLDTVPEGGINPWQVSGQSIAKPVVMAVQGTCLTLGIELMLASDIVVAADSTTFGQIEVETEPVHGRLEPGPRVGVTRADLLLDRVVHLLQALQTEGAFGQMADPTQPPRSVGGRQEERSRTYWPVGCFG